MRYQNPAHKALAQAMRPRLRKCIDRCVGKIVVPTQVGRNPVITQDTSYFIARECIAICEAFAKAENLGPDFLEACGVPEARVTLRL